MTSEDDGPEGGTTVTVHRTMLLRAAALAVLVAGGVGLVVDGRAGGGLDPTTLQAAETALSCTLVGLLIVGHQPRNRIGLLLFFTGLLFGVGLLAEGILRNASIGGGAPRALEQLAFAWTWLQGVPLTITWMMFILTFPEGRFHRSFWRWFFLVSVGAYTVAAVATYLVVPAGVRPDALPFTPPTDLAGPLADGTAVLWLVQGSQVLRLVLPLLAVAGLVDRFRRADLVVRQQIKWLLLAVVATVAGIAIGASVQGGGVVSTVGSWLFLATAPLPSVATALAIFRYRLWAIDQVISRTFVFGLVWAATSVAVLILAVAAGVAVGGLDERIVSALTLALLVTVAGQPLRVRLEGLVTRVVYGERPGGYAVLSRFGMSLARPIVMRELAAEVAAAVRRGLGVSWAGVWLYVATDEAGALRPIAVTGLAPSPTTLVVPSTISLLKRVAPGCLGDDLPVDLATALRPLWTTPPAAVGLLIAGDELIGFLACGQRPRDPVGPADLDLLTTIARQSALALRNLRLEAELRQRYDELREQAEELRRSRQRLVTAQDTERRRIERNLHDGVQQQLVTLAARLQRGTLANAGKTRDLLAELATEAEETVFALQELGRGIYPSLLVDQGLGAALRTLAERLPLEVRVEVEPRLVGQRFSREVEAALYFVAREAMTNAQKHAPEAPITVSLRSDQEGKCLALEVHDDGPGFDRGSSGGGTGLQNMEDRVAAVGGTFAIASRPGAGTWIRAQVPLAGDVVELRPPGRVSRR
jgi:signal transduction histidine kinase